MSKINVTLFLSVYFCTFYSVHLCVYPVFLSHFPVLNSAVILQLKAPLSLRVKNICPLTLFLCNITLVIIRYSSFHTNFKNILLISETIPMGFNWSSIESVDQFVRTYILNILYFSLYRHSIFLLIYIFIENSPLLYFFNRNVSDIVGFISKNFILFCALFAFD